MLEKQRCSIITMLVFSSVRLSSCLELNNSSEFIALIHLRLLFHYIMLRLGYNISVMSTHDYKCDLDYTWLYNCLIPQRSYIFFAARTRLPSDGPASYKVNGFPAVRLPVIHSGNVPADAGYHNNSGGYGYSLRGLGIHPFLSACCVRHNGK